jgi:photosystem II stability/assembly factor-like uncharacterized protein
MRFNFLIFLSLIALSLPFFTIAQVPEILSATPSKVSIRGMCVVSEKMIWVSGSKGTVGRSQDSGHTWKWITVAGFEKSEFRDIEAFDETSAVIMAVGEPAYILRTSDGGESWKIVYENKTPGIFLDAMEFWNLHSGIVVGDPLDGRLFIARTFDGGFNWRPIPTEQMPLADSGEAMFASSGTNVQRINPQEAVVVTGGKSSRLMKRNQAIKLPLLQGKESTGANSIAVKNKKIWITVGGDFTKKDDRTGNCAITSDGGNNWHTPTPGFEPTGYRSCVRYLRKKTWVTCGLNGIDISYNDGQTWQNISKDGYHVCQPGGNGKVVYFAGGNGQIARIKW